MFDAAHAFDNPEPSAMYYPDAIASGNCRYEPRRDGFREIGSTVIRPWEVFDRYFADCSTFGAHTGTNAEAARGAQEAVLDFLDRYVMSLAAMDFADLDRKAPVFEQGSVTALPTAPSLAIMRETQGAVFDFLDRYEAARNRR